MPRRRSSEIVIISSADPQPLVSWLCDTYGLGAVLQSVAQYQAAGPSGPAPTNRTSGKKRGPKKGSTKKGGAKKGRAKRGSSENGRRSRKQAEAGTE